MATVRTVSFGIDFGIRDKKLGEANRKIDLLKRNVSQSNTALGTMAAKARLAGQELKTTFSKGLATLEKYKYKLLGVATAVSTAMFNIVKAGAKFDYQITRTGLVAEATTEQVKMLSEEAKKLGINTRFTASEAAAGQEMLARMGFEVKEIIEALPGILDMAAASDLNLADSARITAKSLNVMGYAAEGAIRVADVLLKASTSAGATVAQLGTAFTEVAGEAAGAGWEIEEMAAALGVLADKDELGTRAGRRFRSVVQDMLSPTAQMTSEMNKLGIELWEDENNFKSLISIVKEFELGLEGLPLREREKSLSKMFTKRGLAIFRKILSAGSEELTNFEKKLFESGGTAKMMAEKQINTLIGAFRELKGSINVAAINMSLTFTPMMKHFVQSVKDGVNVFNELPPMTQGLVGGLGLVTTIVLGLATALAFLVKIVPPIINVFKWLGSTALFKTIAGGIGLTAGQVGLLTLGIIALYFVFEDLYYTMEKNYDGVLVPLIDKFLDFIGVGWDFVDVWNGVKYFFDDLFDSIIIFSKGFAGVIAGVLKGIGELLWALVNFDAEGVLESFSTIIDGINAEGILESFPTIIDGINAIPATIYTGLKAIGKAMVDGILWSLDLLVGTPYSILAQQHEKFWNNLIVEVASWVGIELPEITFPSWSEIKNSFSEMGSLIKQDWDNLVSEVESWPKITFPSWSEMGSLIKQDWDNLVSKVESWPKITFPSWSDFSVINWSKMEKELDNWWGNIKNWFDKAFDIKSIIEDAFDFNWSSLIPDWIEPFIPGLDGNNVNQQPNNNQSSENTDTRTSIIGGLNPVNKTTNNSNKSNSKQENTFNISIDNSNGDDEDLMLKIKRIMQDEFTKSSLSETGGI